MLSISLVLALIAAWAVDTPQAPDPREIIRRSVNGDRVNRDRLRDYVYIQRTETRRLDKGGGVNKRESETFEVMNLYGSEYRKKIAENDQPLSEKEAAKVAKDLEKEEEKLRNEPESQRQARLAKRAKEQAEIRQLLAEIPEAYGFVLAGEEVTETGRRAWVIDATPKPGYKPKAPRADLLPKFKGRFWVDQNSYQWLKLNAETVDTVSFGWILFRLQKGALIRFEQRPLESGLWVPVKIESRANLKLGLLKSLGGEFEITFRDWRRFSTDSKIVDVAEAETNLTPPH